VCELLLRGPQTPGELRSRVPRMAELPDASIIDALLEGLARRPEGPIVQQLPREAGRRDSRWAQLFEELPAVTAAPETPPHAEGTARSAGVPVVDLAARVAQLEGEVAELRAELESLRRGPR
jgi:uncharacterized protein YceH (UPF0502 family)